MASQMLLQQANFREHRPLLGMPYARQGMTSGPRRVRNLAWVCKPESLSVLLSGQVDRYTIVQSEISLVVFEQGALMRPITARASLTAIEVHGFLP